MQEDERDLLEVLIFDEIEETVGTWLRTIIQRLEKEQKAVRRHHPPAVNPKRQNVETNAFLPKARSEACKTGVSACIGPATSSSDFGPIQF
jgi:hypothetical protein